MKTLFKLNRKSQTVCLGPVEPQRVIDTVSMTADASQYTYSDHICSLFLGWMQVTDGKVLNGCLWGVTRATRCLSYQNSTRTSTADTGFVMDLMLMCVWCARVVVIICGKDERLMLRNINQQYGT
jgi:hypothetical protein